MEKAWSSMDCIKSMDIAWKRHGNFEYSKSIKTFTNMSMEKAWKSTEIKYLKNYLKS